eukprot:3830626-Amphidinium_carterae.1
MTLRSILAQLQHQAGSTTAAIAAISADECICPQGKVARYSIACTSKETPNEIGERSLYFGARFDMLKTFLQATSSPTRLDLQGT